MSARRHAGNSTARHSDDWLITYADTITVLLCVFVVLLAVHGAGPRFDRFVEPPPAAAPAPAFPPLPIVVVPVRGAQDAPREFAGRPPDPRPPGADAEESDRGAAPPAAWPPPPAPPRVIPSAGAASVVADAGRAGRVQLRAKVVTTPAPAATREHTGVQANAVDASDAAAVRGPGPVGDGKLPPQSPPRARSGQPPGNRIVIFQCSDTAFFASGSAALSGTGRHILTQLLPTLRASRFAGYHITVEGHTDDEPISDTQFPSNWELSAARAASVVRFFVEQGIARDRLRAVGYADTRPLAPNRDAAGNPIPANQARNRRVIVELEKIDREPAALGR